MVGKPYEVPAAEKAEIRKRKIIEYGEERKMHGHCQSVLKLFGREFARCLNAIKQRTGLLS